MYTISTTPGGRVDTAATIPDALAALAAQLTDQLPNGPVAWKITDPTGTEHRGSNALNGRLDLLDHRRRRTRRGAVHPAAPVRRRGTTRRPERNHRQLPPRDLTRPMLLPAIMPGIMGNQREPATTMLEVADVRSPCGTACTSRTRPPCTARRRHRRPVLSNANDVAAAYVWPPAAGIRTPVHIVRNRADLGLEGLQRRGRGGPRLRAHDGTGSGHPAPGPQVATGGSTSRTHGTGQRQLAKPTTPAANHRH